MRMTVVGTGCVGLVVGACLAETGAAAASPFPRGARVERGGGFMPGAARLTDRPCE